MDHQALRVLLANLDLEAQMGRLVELESPELRVARVLLDLREWQVRKAPVVSQAVQGILERQDFQLLMVGMAKWVRQDLLVHLDLQAKKVRQGPRAFLGWMVLQVATVRMGHKDRGEPLVPLGSLVKKELLELQACQGCLDRRVLQEQEDRLVLKLTLATLKVRLTQPKSTLERLSTSPRSWFRNRRRSRGPLKSS